MNKQMIVSYLVSLLLVAIIIAFVDLEEVLRQVIGFGAVHFTVISVLSIATFVFRGIIWKELLKPFTEISLLESTYITTIGFFANNVLPLRIGEIVRAYVLSVHKKIGKVKSFSSVLAERIVEGLTLVAFFVAGIAFLPSIGPELKQLILLPVALFVALLLVFLFPGKALAITRKLFSGFKFFYKVEHLLEDFVSGGKAMRNGLRPNAIIWGASIATWGLLAVIYHVAAVQLGLEFSLAELLLLVSVTGLSVMIPSAPGFIGTFEFGFILAFSALGLSAEAATSMAVILHLAFWISTNIAGLIALNRLNLSFSSIMAMEKVEEAKERAVK
ncbi:MAG: flippase-like domain-containing protein [Candidatus Diapherotrites archaeon]|uniref:Flippase-like domain-containing protein n=1 Tax=Candidatus Iainarchaeum sp. TaxID=3101447 RepID=A0A7J4ISZ4_9ARCH|nr:MAG: hypothetical protein QT03_C0001G0541 [archaeon GW2011_AR10]MBS3058962.1 flippase-like domain-containing protein [Candidatus Diapherotrites archaeon]HIH08592.1 flippase-like domain-containing protein [Candidatus Diapherotrites archaeon]